MHKNVTQEFAGASFGVSQATVSWRWDLLRPLIGQCSPSSCPTRTRSLAREPCWWTARTSPPGSVSLAASSAGDRKPRSFRKQFALSVHGISSSLLAHEPVVM